MKTYTPSSKIHNCVTAIATATGSVALLALSILFLINNYDSVQTTLKCLSGDKIEVLDQSRSDAMSEHISIREEQTDDENECQNKNCSDIHCTKHSIQPSVELLLDEIKFQSNDCIYVDKQRALPVLKNYIPMMEDYFEQQPCGKIYLVGCAEKTESTNQSDLDLSQRRTEAVLQSFVELGIDENRLVAIGLGTNDPWHEEEWQDGQFVEEIAAKNRRIWIIPDSYTKQIALVETVRDLISVTK